MSGDHVARNRAARQRLAAVIARLGESTVVLAGGWTAAGLLAHLAFWDRFVEARFRNYLDRGIAFGTYPDEFIDVVNAASLPQWMATPLSFAAVDATSAAEAVDTLIESLPAEEVDKVLASKRPRMLDRSLHRNEHLDALERGLA